MLARLTESCNVRFEERAREFFYMARLTFLGNRSESKYESAKESYGEDLKLGDLFMDKVKSLERGMEA